MGECVFRLECSSVHARACVHVSNVCEFSQRLRIVCVRKREQVTYRSLPICRTSCVLPCYTFLQDAVKKTFVGWMILRRCSTGVWDEQQRSVHTQKWGPLTLKDSAWIKELLEQWNNNVCCSWGHDPVCSPHRLVDAKDGETAGALMTFFLALGLSLGAAFSFLLRALV